MPTAPAAMRKGSGRLASKAGGPAAVGRQTAAMSDTYEFVDRLNDRDRVTDELADFEERLEGRGGPAPHRRPPQPSGAPQAAPHSRRQSGPAAGQARAAAPRRLSGNCPCSEEEQQLKSDIQAVRDLPDAAGEDSDAD
eukprot:TRINITY_DN70231_c0_g1_i1.p2 TRINITY_DN70231_c0_g1~~TRINITY_DN70231_c0_g1_i1.p2  ORF type:complete len:161 (+),score=55.58 TRINITY_DN70231_c0_g1_i1:72-485(+)